jgi:hypothetical protein
MPDKPNEVDQLETILPMEKLGKSTNFYLSKRQTSKLLKSRPIRRILNLVSELKRLTNLNNKSIYISSIYYKLVQYSKNSNIVIGTMQSLCDQNKKRS